MITITLNQIREASPHLSLWEKVLDAHQHLDMDTPFPLSSVLGSNDLDDALWCLETLGNEEILRRFALYCARQAQHLMTDDRSIKALDVAEMFLDGKATKDELDAADADARDAAYDATRDAARDPKRAAAELNDRIAAYVAYAAVKGNASSTAAYAAAYDGQAATQIIKLKEMLD